jgi:hypothetical protein
MSKLHHFPGPWLLMSNKKVSQLPHRLEHLALFLAAASYLSDLLLSCVVFF